MTNTRWKIGILMFLGIVINYMDRVNISHAIVLIAEDMNLSPMQQGIIMSSFSWGYVLFMLAGGILVDRFGPRVVNALSCIAWSAFTAMSALVGSYQLFLLSRFLLGAGEAPIFPGNASVVKRWFPLKERGKATARLMLAHMSDPH
jgi:MFS transporter, ACS family, D-galactonate transporter